MMTWSQMFGDTLLEGLVGRELAAHKVDVVVLPADGARLHPDDPALAFDLFDLQNEKWQNQLRLIDIATFNTNVDPQAITYIHTYIHTEKNDEIKI